MTNGTVTHEPTRPLDLLVSMPGATPRPVSQIVVVPPGQLARLAPGHRLSVPVPPGPPDAEATQW